MNYLKYSEAAQAAKALAIGKGVTVNIARQADGSYTIRTADNSANGSVEGLSAKHNFSAQNSSALRDFKPRPEPELQPVKVLASSSSQPPKGVELKEAISLLEWIVDGLLEISTMKYRSENTSYTDYAKHAATRYRTPLSKLHGRIGDDSTEFAIAEAVNELDWLYSQRSRRSVQSCIKVALDNLNIVSVNLKSMRENGIETHCGIKWSTTGYRHKLVLYEWGEVRKGSKRYNQVYRGQRK